MSTSDKHSRGDAISGHGDSSRPWIARPASHFMGLAPLDVWARVLLIQSPAPLNIHPRYYLRFASLMGTSLFGTLVTLPERIGFPALTYRPIDSTTPTTGHKPALVDHAPGALAVLGYYRTGTTHLQYLLSCDPNLATPKFAQVIAPHGFLCSWIFLRLFLIPFLSAKRPQDDVGIGPEWPAEDDFATCNFNGSSSLIGRLMLPEQFVHHQDFDFRSLSEERLRTRWVKAEAAFLKRLSVLNPRKRLLLKSPSHTLRAPLLQSLFAAEGSESGQTDANVKFIHISRRPDEVVRSNLSMFKRLTMYNLQDLPSDSALIERIVEEYATFERSYLDACNSGAIAANNSIYIRFEDLRADPIGVLREAYEHLDLEWSEPFERRVTRYLQSVSEYKPATTTTTATSNTASQSLLTDVDRQDLAFIESSFGHDRPVRAKVALPEPAPSEREKRSQTRLVQGIIGSALVAVLVGLVWVGYVYCTFNESDYFVWLAGIAIGYSTLRFAVVGNRKLGLWAAALTLMVHLAVAMPNVRYAYYKRYDPTRQHVLWSELIESARQEVVANHTIFWMVMGMLTAYRFASRGTLGPPGEE